MKKPQARTNVTVNIQEENCMQEKRVTPSNNLTIKRRKENTLAGRKFASSITGNALSIKDPRVTQRSARSRDVIPALQGILIQYVMLAQNASFP